MFCWQTAMEPFSVVLLNPLKDLERIEITATYRLLVLLPTKKNQKSQEIWVPYLIDTGSPQTFLTNLSRSALGLGDYAIDYEIYVAGCKIRFGQASDHFSDINIIGTDLLARGNLIVSYNSRQFGLKIKNYTINIPPDSKDFQNEVNYTDLIDKNVNITKAEKMMSWKG